MEDNNIQNIDSDFEPQQRPRTWTWPMKRPNIGGRGSDSQESDVAMKLEPTIMEAGSQEQLMSDGITTIKQESPDAFLPNGFMGDYNPLVGSPTANQVTDVNRLLSPQQETVTNICSGQNGNNTLSFTTLDPMTHSKPSVVSNFDTVNLSPSQTGFDIKPNVVLGNCTTTSELQQPMNNSSTSVENSATTTVASPTVAKPKTSSRKNAWGNMSYADLITQAIESSPDKRLTLAQIYDWMVKNIAYFNDKGDSNSSAGWKNSIRHNLSLHSKFKRIQNEGTGKSSWWVINHDAKPGKCPRRRVQSMDTSNVKNHQKREKARQKKEFLKKQKSKQNSPPWTRSPTSGDIPYDHLNASLASEFRQRTSSNASSIGRVSPTRSGNCLAADLVDDGPPPLSPVPLSSSYTSSGPFGDLIGTGRMDFFDSIDMNTGETPDLLESIAGMDMMSSASPIGTNADQANVYLNTIDGPQTVQQQLPGVNNANRGIISSPNLASLLQQGVGTQGKPKLSQLQSRTPNKTVTKPLPNMSIDTGMRGRSNTMPKLQPQPKYNMSDNMHCLPSGDLMATERYNNTNYSTADAQISPPNPYLNTPAYSYNRPQPQVQQQPQQDNQSGLSSYVNQHKTLFQLLEIQRPSDEINNVGQAQQLNMNQQKVSAIPVANQQTARDGNLQMRNYTQPSQIQALSNEAPPQGNGSQSNLLQMNQGKFPSDINLDNQDIFDPGMLDFEQMMQDMTPASDAFGGMDFSSYFPIETPNFSSGLELDNTMDTGNSTAQSSNINKMNGPLDNSYPYPNNMDSLALQQQQSQQQQQQQQQQQRYGQPPMYNMNAGDNCQPQVLMGIEGNNGSMLVGGPSRPIGVVGPGLPQHFNSPHHTLRTQSSVGSIGNYQM
ncbi:uncharacterized protein LOC143465119 isoform X2 [Clavelina lepadiformis]|uniref:uncharacterized protein LOC143465119 isoform X2 n=1 Tax=Clavelina lepadiformis TaxID=159417 RepID=UPI004041E232